MVLRYLALRFIHQNAAPDEPVQASAGVGLEPRKGYTDPH
jgi:hypothetical protein